MARPARQFVRSTGKLTREEALAMAYALFDAIQTDKVMVKDKGKAGR